MGNVAPARTPGLAGIDRMADLSAWDRRRTRFCMHLELIGMGAMSTAALGKNEKIVLDALSRAATPLSAYQILDAEGVRASGVKAPLTVYRALTKLIEGGLVHRIETLNAFVVCEHEPHVEPAAFMICESCKRTLEIATAHIADMLSREAKAHDFKVARINIEIAGLCAKCRASE